MARQANASKTATSGYKPIVPAVDQASKLLMCLGNHPDEKMTVTRICKEIGIHKSKGYSILNTLQQFNLITKDNQDKTYSLGPGLIFLARNVIDQLDTNKIAKPWLKKIALETGSTALLGIIADDKVYVTARHEGDKENGITYRQGHTFHITHGAHGKALAAFMNANQRKNLLKNNELNFYNKDKEIDLNYLDKELKQCRKDGYAVDAGEKIPGINAVSSPIFDYSGNLIGCVILVGTFNKKMFKTYGKKVADISRKISEESGADLKKYGK